MEQTIRRDELKMESKKYVEQLTKQIAENDFHNAELENLVRILKNKLDNTKGKKVYGYLKPEVKKTVDEIFRILSQEENISVHLCLLSVSPAKNPRLPVFNFSLLMFSFNLW